MTDDRSPEPLPRVLFVDHAGVLGGAELYLLDAAAPLVPPGRVVLFEDGPFRRRLDAAGLAAEVWDAGGDVLGVSRDAGIVHALGALPGVARLVARLARRARDYDVLFANSQKAFVAAALAGAIARRPVVWNLHDILTADHFSRLNTRLVVTLANRFAARVIANSDATRAAFVAAGGRADRVHVVYNGLDAAPFDAVTDAAAARARASFAPTDAPLVGLFSRLAPWKGQRVLLDALARLPDVHAALVGDALFGDEARYADALHEDVARLGLGGRVHFLGFRDDVPTLMRAVDVVVHTSTAPEPFGRVIVEGMLARRPVVAARAGGAAEIVRDGETGRLVPPGDPEALADALAALFEDPAAAAALAAAGRAEAETRFSVDALQADILRHVRAVV